MVLGSGGDGRARERFSSTKILVILPQGSLRWTPDANVSYWLLKK